MPGDSIFMKISVTDNIANPVVTLSAGKGDDIFAYVKKVTPEVIAAQTDWTVPGGYVEGDCGMRVLFALNDGRFNKTVNLSRNIRISNSDDVAPEMERWIPLGATAVLDTIQTQKALKGFTETGKSWMYDIKRLRLFRWIGGDWQEYADGRSDNFSFVSGRVVWLKTRQTDAFNFGAGRSVSLKDPYVIKLPAKDWTDFCLPFRFNIRIGDVLAATDQAAATSLQFFVWKTDVKGRYMTNQFYLPMNPPYDDKKLELAYMKDGNKMAYSVWNDMNTEVELKIPGTPTVLSPIQGAAAKKAAGWSLAVRSSTPEGGEMSPVFCAYVPGGNGSVAYPMPPSWGNTSVGIYDAGRNRIFGNVIARELVNGGYAYELVFENRQPSPATITCRIERLAGENAEAALLDPGTGMAGPASAELSVTVAANSRQYRWLAVGSRGYIEGFGTRLAAGEFSLVRITPNPLRGGMRIEYRIPYGGVEAIRCEMLDQLGRVVWSTKAGKSVHPGRNEITWNPRGRRLASGAYIIRLTGFDGNGKVTGTKLARIMYLP
jgi:hypothetical protein